MNSYITLRDVPMPAGYTAAPIKVLPGLTEGQAGDLFGQETDPAVTWMLWRPDYPQVTGSASFYGGTPPVWPAWNSAINTAFVRQPVPRNLIWVGSNHLPPGDGWSGLLQELADTAYTHVILCFLHFRVGDGTSNSPTHDLNLVINGPNPVGNYADFWQAAQSLKGGAKPKTLMISIGGWGSGTWQAIYGREEEAAQILAQFVTENGFDGLDVNFEGGVGASSTVPFPGTDPSQVFRDDVRWLDVVAKFVVALRGNLKNLALSLAPICDNVVGGIGQLDAINRAVAADGRTWLDILSWVNVQFYLYPTLVQDIAESYANLVGPSGIPTNRIALGFPLFAEGGLALDNGQRYALGFPTFTGDTPPPLTAEQLAVLEAANRDATRKAANFLVSLLQPPAGEVLNSQLFQAPVGAFVWNYRSTKHPADLGWDLQMDAALNHIYRTPVAVPVPPVISDE